MSKLSSAQRLILTTAADRTDGAVLPLPEALARRGRTLMLKPLLGRGLIAARPAQDGEPAWSGGKDEQQQALEVTAEGRALIESERQALPQRKRGRRKPGVRRQPRPAAPGEGQPAGIRPGTKQTLVLEMLRRPEGASIAEIQRATGWLPHTGRAALTGLKHKGFILDSARREDGARGEVHLVEALDHGLAYRGQRYASLSAIARTITGTPWSGPVFFGLKRRSGPHHA